MTKRDLGGRKRRLKRINEARRRRKDDDVDVGGISRLETTTTTTADHPPTQRDFGGDAMMMMAVDKVVVAKHAMKKATKKAKFLESACASRALLFSFPKREMEERLDVWVPLFQLWLCSFRLFQLCESTNDTSLPCSLFARRRRARAHTQRYVGRTNQTPPLERPSRKNNNRANRSRRSARASNLAWRISPRISTRRCWRRRRRYERRVRGRRRCRRCCRTR